MNRRTFLIAAGAARALRGAPADEISLGVIGAGSRGTFVMGVFQKNAGVRVAGVCDVYEPNLENALSAAAKGQGGVAANSYRDYRRVLDDKSINAVLIATPEHWHHRMVLDALAAGKDIYVEKPLCQTPEQGVDLVAAEQRTKNIVQVGMQRRSYDLYLEGRRLVAAGELGAVRMVRSWWLNTSLDTKPATKLGGPLDWEQWQGPAERRPLDPDRFRHWRSYSEYSGGIVADQGAHVYDGIHLLMNASYPLAVNASGGRPHVPKVDTPESVVVIAEYPEDFLGVFSINYAAMRYRSRNDQLNQLDGDRARMDIGREELKIWRQGMEDAPAMTRQSATGFGKATDAHVENFLRCVRTRETPAAPMRLGFQAALVVQLANRSLKTGRRMRWNHERMRVEG